MRTCKNCIYWLDLGSPHWLVGSGYRSCTSRDLFHLEAEGYIKSDRAFVPLEPGQTMMTGPDFGCNQHKPIVHTVK